MTIKISTEEIIKEYEELGSGPAVGRKLGISVVLISSRLKSVGYKMHGNLRGVRPKNVLERFNEHTTSDLNSDCILWTGYRDKRGYGRFGIGSKVDKSEKIILTHRFIWEYCNGKIPDGLHVLHKCDNPPCVNVEHLFLGDDLDNNIDKAKKWRGRKSKKGLPFGVIVQPSNGRYQAVITTNYKQRRFGTYDTAEEASTVAVAEKCKLYGIENNERSC